MSSLQDKGVTGGSPIRGATEAEEELRVPWSRSDRPVPRRVIQPLRSFLETEVAGGLLLLLALLVALVWANAPFRHTYEELWTSSIVARVGGWAVVDDLRGFIRDGLMALFFLVVGLEIKREMLTGELRDRRAALLAVAGAAGGMAGSALAFLAVNPATPASHGWGAAMPTDIALALGVLALALPRAPSAVRIFLLSLAIADDLGTMVVVAVFYSHRIAPEAVAVAAGLGAVVFLAGRVNVRSGAVYGVLGIAMWLALHDSGVSPTLAGVALGLLTPSARSARPREVSREAHRIADETVDDPVPPDADAAQWLELERLSRAAVSPLALLERVLHPWTSYVIVPLFVLADAGVSFSGHALASPSAERVAIGMLAARLIGKPLGILALSWLVVRLGAAQLPTSVTWRQVIGVAAAAGVPFSVSLFVAELAFPQPLLDAARVGIILAAVLSGIVGFLLLRPPRRSPGDLLA